MTNHISLISFQIQPSLDIKQLIINSMEQRHATLTIPWITEYLAMLDFLTLRLSYYNSVHKILFRIYRRYIKSSKKLSYNRSLVRFSLGWLFELPHFPDTEFFSHLSEADNIEMDFENKQNGEKMLDDLELVDQNILYTFCPYLEEIKKLLLTDVSNNNATVKHITPVTTIHSGKEITKRKLEVCKKIKISSYMLFRGNYYFQRAQF